MADWNNEAARFQAAELYGLAGQDLDDFLASLRPEGKISFSDSQSGPSTSLTLDGICSALELPAAGTEKSY